MQIFVGQSTDKRCPVLAMFENKIPELSGAKTFTNMHSSNVGAQEVAPTSWNITIDQWPDVARSKSRLRSPAPRHLTSFHSTSVQSSTLFGDSSVDFFGGDSSFDQLFSEMDPPSSSRNSTSPASRSVTGKTHSVNYLLMAEFRCVTAPVRIETGRYVRDIC